MYVLCKLKHKCPSWNQATKPYKPGDKQTPVFWEAIKQDAVQGVCETDSLDPDRQPWPRKATRLRRRIMRRYWPRKVWRRTCKTRFKGDFGTDKSLPSYHKSVEQQFIYEKAKPSWWLKARREIFWESFDCQNAFHDRLDCQYRKLTLACWVLKRCK